MCQAPPAPRPDSDTDTETDADSDTGTDSDMGGVSEGDALSQGQRDGVSGGESESRKGGAAPPPPAPAVEEKKEQATYALVTAAWDEATLVAASVLYASFQVSKSTNPHHKTSPAAQTK